jgi:Do/DeqQ family serine protease
MKRRSIMASQFYKNHCSAIALALLGFMLVFSPMVFAASGDDAGASVDLRTDIARVAKQNIPAVVHIEVTQRQELTNSRLPFENDPFFRYFFDMPMTPRKFKRELKGLGTGMIMDTLGHILTNNHVVGKATEIQVLLSDGKQYKALIVGTDPKTDLAVIKIDAKGSLPHVSFGDSDQLDVGDWVVAIGHPRGLDQTVTQGIISAKHRRGITDPSSYQDFLQTDAAINPGNSGGPLLNLKGEVIGINAAIVSQSGGFEGLGFAIPSNMALHISKELIANGKVARGWLGVSIQDLTAELADSFHLKTTKGALIADVVKGGPAEKAGIKRGDIVTSYHGKEIVDSSALRNEVANTVSGRKVIVGAIRDGEKHSFKVTIGDLESATKMLATSLKDLLGADVRPVTAKEAKKYNLDSDLGVAIVWLDPKGSLGGAGFELGDIILEINSQPVGSLKSFVDLVGSLKSNKRITLLALDHRTGRTGYVQVPIG